MQRLHTELVAELVRHAAQAGVEWEAALDRADLPKASRSRVNSGDAGLPTIARVRQAIEELTQEARDRGDARELDEAMARSAELPAPALEAGRWVIVEGKQGLFFGRTDATDTEIAERGHVRLRDCRSIRGDASPSTFAVIGPRDPQQIGLPAPSALILGVHHVYDCTANAVKAFMSPA